MSVQNSAKRPNSACSDSDNVHISAASKEQWKQQQVSAKIDSFLRREGCIKSSFGQIKTFNSPVASDDEDDIDEIPQPKRSFQIHKPLQESKEASAKKGKSDIEESERQRAFIAAVTRKFAELAIKS